MSLLDELLEKIDALPAKDRANLEAMVRDATSDMPWTPNPGPQTLAYFSEADELFYGGGAGGGKTDLLCGLALTAHRKSLIMRREGTDLGAIELRLEEIIGNRDGYNSQKRVWRRGEQYIELNSCPHEKDKTAFQGHPDDLKGFDEICQFTESQYTYIIGWRRTATEGQRTRIVCTGNPPSTPEGYWVKQRWGAWLDPTHPNPAAYGELRWYTTINGVDTEVSQDWRGVDEHGKEIKPTSRTFILALLSDNPYVTPEYRAAVQAMPEPLRSQLLYGDFNVAERDGFNQVIPTAWIRAAQARWKPEGRTAHKMTCIGVDVAQGGADETVLARRHGDWIDELIVKDGAETPDGNTAAGIVVTYLRDQAIVAPDMGGGYGGALAMRLGDVNVRVNPMIPAGKATAVTQDGRLKFKNLRAQWWWRVRELLDPASKREIALPRDERLVSDLAAPTWTLTSSGIQIEEKDNLRKRLGRSPDRGDAVVLALNCDAGPISIAEAVYQDMLHRSQNTDYNPFTATE